MSGNRWWSDPRYWPVYVENVRPCEQCGTPVLLLDVTDLLSSYVGCPLIGPRKLAWWEATPDEDSQGQALRLCSHDPARCELRRPRGLPPPRGQG